MRHPGCVVIGLAILSSLSVAQGMPKVPKRIPGVIDASNLHKQPTKIVKPLYPKGALESWIQGTVSLDVVVGKTGLVELIGPDDYCCMLPSVLVQSAITAVRQWKWDPLLRSGKPVRFRTRVAVNFVLDETSPPIDVCTVIRNATAFDSRVVNVSGTVEKTEGLKILHSSRCAGSVVVADDPDSGHPQKDTKYAAFEKAVAATPVSVSLRGQLQQDRSPGELCGIRLVLERVLKVGTE